MDKYIDFEIITTIVINFQLQMTGQYGLRADKITNLLRLGAQTLPWSKRFLLFRA